MKHILSLVLFFSSSIFSMASDEEEKRGIVVNNCFLPIRIPRNGPYYAGFSGQSADDDVLAVSHWEEKVAEEHSFNHPNLAFKNQYLYIPQQYSPEQASVNLWVVLQGGKETCLEEDQNTFNDIKKAAAWYATTTNKKLKLLSFKWSGELTERTRKSIANHLREYLSKLDDYTNAEISLLTHDQGGEIVNYLSRTSQFKDRPLENLFYFSCLPGAVPHYSQPEHFKQLIYFYADKEIIKPTSFVRQKIEESICRMAFLLAPLIGNGISPFIKVARAINNIVMLYMTARIIQEIKKSDYTVQNTIFPLQKGKLVAGIRTCCNSDQGEAGFSEMIKNIRFLPPIVKALHYDYLTHYLNGSLFDLHVTQSGTEKKAIITLSNKRLKERKESEFPCFFNQLKVMQTSAARLLPYDSVQIMPTATENVYRWWARSEEEVFSDRELEKIHPLSNAIRSKHWWLGR